MNRFSYVISLPTVLETLIKVLHQEFHSAHLKLLEFLDEYRLATSVFPSIRYTPPYLLLLDTEQVSSGTPVQTLFHPPTTYDYWNWVTEAAGYKPSPQDILTAPFYSEPSQRILAFSLGLEGSMLVMKVETLLRLSRERAGEEVQWQEWETYLLKTPTLHTLHTQPWVSGSRLFRPCRRGRGNRCELHVYDFSARGHMKSLHQSAGNGSEAVYPSVRYHLPWLAIDIQDINFGHDSMVFQVVSPFFILMTADSSVKR